MTTASFRKKASVRHRSITRSKSFLATSLAGLVVATLWLTSLPAAAVASNPPGDPPGNNGTIKIVNGESDTDPGNEPQLENCLIWLEFYGFDQDQQSVITFTAIPPTGDGQEVLTHTATISDDAAGGGQDKDATLSYNLSAALANLPLDTDRGYHLKVTSDTIGAPGGAKQKVLWMRCAPAAPSSLRVTKSVEGARVADNGDFTFTLLCNHSPLDRTFTLAADGVLDVTGVPSGTVCTVTETDARGATATRLAETPSDGNDDGTVQITTGSTVAFTNVFPAPVVGAAVAGSNLAAGVQAPQTAPASGARVAAAGAERLPETGVATNIAAVVGLALILFGGLLVSRSKQTGLVLAAVRQDDILPR